jgi:transcription elongation factor GreA
MTKMTKEGYDRLVAKLETLKKKRAKISKAIGEAREHGDLKENAAYHEAKKDQGLNEMRIMELEAKLKDVEVVAKGTLDDKEGIGLGKTVKIKALDTGEEYEYQLVSEMEADILENKISPASPVGAALRGQQKGDVIEVQAPRGWIKYKILDVK